LAANKWRELIQKKSMQALGLNEAIIKLL